MKTFNYTIIDEQGIHARPAGILVKSAGGFKSKISIQKGDKQGDLKKVFSVMALAAKKDDTIIITFDGEDEEDAFDKISELVKSNL